MVRRLFLGLLCSAFISACGGGGADISTSQESADNMPAGLQVIGDHGVIQIDENYTNMGLRHRGTMSTGGLVDLVVADVDTPMLCIASPNAAVMLVGATRSGNSITYRLASAATTFNWFVFDKMRASASASGAGIQVFTADGAIAFDSTNAPMRIAGIASVPNAQQGVFPPPAGSIAAPAGTYAACLSHPRIRVTYGNQPDSMLGDGVRTGPNGATTEMVLFRQIPPYTIPGDYLQPVGGKLFLVDVTNL